ncbi:MAG TPA: MFS transporter [Pseudonocardiaceae bacterium]|nr:MFS transporter [Pseudonocardiaceae bacterium]
MPQTGARSRLPRGYWRLWWATGIDSVGDGAFTAAVPLLAVTLTRDPRLVSLVAATTYLPWLLVSLPAGVLVDRRERAGLMWRAQAAQAVLVGVVAVLVAVHRVGVPVLAVAAFGLGAGEVVFSNAAQAILPDLVGKSLLHKANGAQQTILTVGAQFLGPPVGSLLFAVAAGLPFGLDALSFAGSAALLATLPRHPPEPAEHPRMRTATADGLRWLAHHRLLRTMALLLGANTFCNQFGMATLVLLATGPLHVTARGYGVLLAGAAIGSLLGGLTNARLVARFGELPALLASLSANVLLFLGIGLAPSPIVLGFLLGANGFATTLWNIVSVSLRQRIVPTRLFGRINSVYRMLGWGLMPVGALAGGFVADTSGLHAPYLIAGVLRGVALLAALPVFLTALRNPG